VLVLWKGGGAALRLLWASADRHRCFRWTAALSTLLQSIGALCGDSRRGRAWADEGCGGYGEQRTGKRDVQSRHRRPDQTHPGEDGRGAGQYARATVTRLSVPTLARLGALAVATALLGRTFGLQDPLFLASEVALLVSMFVISRYVLPLVDRHDRGATGEWGVGALLGAVCDRGWT